MTQQTDWGGFTPECNLLPALLKVRAEFVQKLLGSSGLPGEAGLVLQYPLKSDRCASFESYTTSEPGFECLGRGFLGCHNSTEAPAFIVDAS